MARRSEILAALGERAQAGWNGNQYQKVGGGIIPPPKTTAGIAALDELRTELAEIDENLMRQELTVLEEAEHLQRRSEILEALGERATIGGQPGNHNASKNEGATVAPSFKTTAGIAAEMGISKRSAQHRLQIARATGGRVGGL